MNHVIPPITHPLGRHWQQPDLSEIEVDEVSALMDKNSFEQLHEYSTSYPSGVYDGKMWRAQTTAGWKLRWYGPASDPDQCQINQRVLLVA